MVVETAALVVPSACSSAAAAASHSRPIVVVVVARVVAIVVAGSYGCVLARIPEIQPRAATLSFLCRLGCLPSCCP